jgi:hypothetical protein
MAYDWPDTERTETPSGGFHLVFEGWATDAHPAHIFALGTNGIGKDIDSPNYTVIPGCVFDNGTSYTTNDAPAVRCPEWIYNIIKNSKSKSRVVEAGEVVVEFDKPENIEAAITFLKEDAEPAVEGSGGDFITLKTAMYLKDLSISPPLAVDLMNEYYNPRCNPQWDIADLERKVANAYSYSSLSKVGGKTAEADFGDDDADTNFAPMGTYNIKTKKYEGAPAPADLTRGRRTRANARAREAERPAVAEKTKLDLVNNWAWISGMERYIARENTTKIWKRTAFDSQYRHMLGPKEGKSMSDLLFSLAKGSIQKYHSVAFKPGEPQTLEDGTVFNLYSPPNIEPIGGDISWWDAHLEYLFPSAEYRDHVLNWMAWLLQYPKRKPKHALIIQGPLQGTGKSFLGWVLRKCVNERNVAVVSQSRLASQFNGWALKAKLIVIEELRAVDRAEVKQNLHDIITEDVISVEQKGVDTLNVDTCFGIFGMTNDDVALMLDDSERRYLIVKTEAEPRDKAYYTALYGRLRSQSDMAAVYYSLMNRDLKGYNGEQAAPDTAAKTVMTKAGRGDLEHFMEEAAGEYPLNGRLITMEDVIAILPARLSSRSGRLYSAIRTVLTKAPFSGEELGQVKMADGTRKRLWAINGKAGILRNTPRDTLASLYAADQKSEGRGTDEAEQEFIDTEDEAG